MYSRLTISSLGLILALLATDWATIAPAQVDTGQEKTPSLTKDRIPPTELVFELLGDPRGTTAQFAQRWGQIFQQLGVSLRVRRAILDDEPETKEVTFGTIRRVTVIGELGSQGSIRFADRTFTPSQTTKLAEWIRELKTYGAQGAPVGKPAFGLSERQFEALFTALSQPTEKEVFGKPFPEALQDLQINQTYPIRMSVEAQQLLADVQQPKPARQSLLGFSKGTALAVFLNEYGLGFHPRRTPAGDIELTVVPLAKSTDIWPLGWPLAADASRQQVAPGLFKIVPVELTDVALKDVLDGVGSITGVPVLIDYATVEAKGIDIEATVVSFPARRTMWSLLLKNVTNCNKMTRQLLVDEQGRPFILVTTLEAGLKSRQRK